MTSWRNTASAAALTCATLGLGFAGAPALAQDADEQTGGRQIERIVVTAQKREESKQDVPLSIGAYDQGALNDAGVQDIKDLIQIAPGLMVTSTQSETITTARIRGIGTVGDNFGLESSVGVYIDGVFRARNGVGFSDLGELERIEVLRGPQGTLFGKNTSAGVISVVTAAPEFEFGGFGELSVGNFGYTRVSGGITGPLVEDQAAFRLFAASGQRDGYNDLVIGQGANATVTDSENQDYYTIRGNLLLTPNANIEARIIADYTDRDEVCCSAVQWEYPTATAGIIQSLGGNVLAPADPDRRVAFANRAYIQRVEDWGFSGEVDVDFDWGTLTSITAYRNWENERAQDIDYTSLDIAFRDESLNYTEISRFSQEVRLAGATDRLDWLVGAFYSNEELTLGDSIQFGEDWEEYLSFLLSAGLQLPPDTGFLADLTNGLGLGIPTGVFPTFPAIPGFTPVADGQAIPGGSGPTGDVYDQEATSFAVFTHNTLSLTENLDATLGLRYTTEDKDNTATFGTSAVPACNVFETFFGIDPVGTLAAAGQPATVLAAVGNVCLPYARTGLDNNGFDQDRSDEEVSGTFRLSYRLAPDVLVFGGYGRGFKAGGFNLDRQFNGPTDATGFTNVDTSFPAEITDAWEAGIKSETFNNSLQLNANIFYQEIENFQLNTFQGTAFVVDSVAGITSQGFELDFLWLPEVDGLDVSGGVAYVDATYDDDLGGLLVGGNDISGQQISLSPEWFVNGQVRYERPLTNTLVGRFSVDGRWVSEYNTGSDLDPEKVQDAFALIGARVAIADADGRWEAELWGKNLTDETYAQVAFDQFAQGGGFGAFLGAPMTWGATVRGRF